MAQPGKRGITPKLNTAPKNIADSLIYQMDSAKISTNRTTAYRLTDKLGERYIAPMDTQRLNFSNNTLMEGRGLAISYLANVGAPAQSRIFSEREEDNDFIFANGYQYWITTPTNALFYDVKDPFTELTYLPKLFGNKQNSEERFNGVMTTNIGKKTNLGADFDYTYARGYYASNGNNLLYYRFFGNYLSDKYEMHSYFRNYNYLNAENGGLKNDRYVTHPDDFIDEKLSDDTKSYPTRYTDTWNRLKGQQFFLTHRYNLGFYRELTVQEKKEAEKRKEYSKKRKERQQQEAAANEPSDKRTDNNKQQADSPDLLSGNTENTEEEEEIDAVFVPVSSIINTFSYEGNSRRFVSNSIGIDTLYDNVYTPIDSAINDYTELWNLKGTLGLSLREGFQDWAKFGLTAYVHLEKRRFTLPEDSARSTINYDEFSTYLGAELSKQQGQLLTYNARGEFCLVGSDIGEFRAEGDLKTQFRLMGKDASIKATGYIKNLTPAFYMRHNHTRYYWWDNNSFKNTQRVYVGGEIDVQQTRTKMTAGVESIQNFIYFGEKGTPVQYGGNLQVINARIKQDFRYRAFGWENEVAYQLSSEKSMLPLPQISAYTNVYIDFTYAKVLNIQIGADAHYFTSYYAPYYEPATQQFENQSEKKVGNYPIINAYANLKLKQARFFVSAYNLGSLFILPPDYFSLYHYPLNPMRIRLGISVYFNN